MNKLYIFIASILMFGGVIFIIGGSVLIIKASNAESWPTTIGIINKSKILEYMEDGFKYYEPEIIYSYSVNGYDYTGHTVSIGSMTTKNYAQMVVQNYTAGSAVKVYYNANDPEDSLLEVGVSKILIFSVIFGIIFIIFSAFLIVFKQQIINMALRYKNLLAR